MMRKTDYERIAAVVNNARAYLPAGRANEMAHDFARELGRVDGRFKPFLFLRGCGVPDSKVGKVLA